MAETTGKIRFGIMGCAFISRKVSRSITLSPNSSIHAVASRSADKAAKFISENGLSLSVKVYGTYEALLEDPEVDAVYIPIPSSMHLKYVTLAAERKKHVLLDKPVAWNVKDFDLMTQACVQNGVQLMDATMWMHHPRTAKMKDFITDAERFGQLRFVHSIFTMAFGPDFFKNDIRVKPDLDGLGVLGDLGWYCIRSILFASDYELPKTVTALPGPVFNEAGVLLQCGASLHWDDGKVATFHCSYFSNLTMDMTALGTNGSLHVPNFVIPFKEQEASFTVASKTVFSNLQTGCLSVGNEHVVPTELPQDALMVKEFANLVLSIKTKGAKPEMRWPILSRKTQLVIDAVKDSIAKGFSHVEVVG